MTVNASQENPWLSITPYVGLRHIGLGASNDSAGTTGNIGNTITNSLFVAIGLETLEYSFNETPWGFTLYGYAANVDLTEQWIANGTTNSNGTPGGTRKNVGTRVSGYYSYLVPSLHYNMQDKKGNGFKTALGYNYRVRSTIILQSAPAISDNFSNCRKIHTKIIGNLLVGISTCCMSRNHSRISIR